MNRLILYLSALILLFGADSLVARNRPLNIGSYNIRCNNPGDGENAWPNRKERVKALILFHEYDVVGVQEARPEQMEDLQQMPGFASAATGRREASSQRFSTASTGFRYSTAEHSGSPKRPKRCRKAGTPL